MRDRSEGVGRKALNGADEWPQKGRSAFCGPLMPVVMLVRDERFISYEPAELFSEDFVVLAELLFVTV